MHHERPWVVSNLEGNDMAAKRKSLKVKDANPDPISGEPGSHPIGTGVGAALGGAAAGAAAGMVGGPVGTVVGAIAGGVGGGLAGKATAEAIDPTAEEAYWRANFENRPYYDRGYLYDDYGPAYRTGWEAKTMYPNAGWTDIEDDIERDWERARGTSRLTWDRARYAVRDAWDRVERPRSAGQVQPGGPDEND
jgi:hypothetical protein